MPSPPEGPPYLIEKTRLGVRDAFATIFKDKSKIDWDEKSKLSHAVTYTFDISCTYCHAELFSVNLSEKGTDAHVYYFHKKGEVRCINCHLNVGHFSEVEAEEVRLAETAVEKWISTLPPGL